MEIYTLVISSNQNVIKLCKKCKKWKTKNFRQKMCKYNLRRLLEHCTQRNGRYKVQNVVIFAKAVVTGFNLVNLGWNLFKTLFLNDEELENNQQFCL